MSRRTLSRAMALWLRRPIGVLYFLAGGLGCLAALVHQEPAPLLALILLGGSLIMLALDIQTVRKPTKPRSRPPVLAVRTASGLRTFPPATAAQVRKSLQLRRQRENADKARE